MPMNASDLKNSFLSSEYFKDAQAQAEFRKSMLNEWVSPSEQKIIYIVARDLRTARLYSNWYRHYIENNPEIVFRYVDHENALRSRIGIEIHFVTTWDENERGREIRDFAKQLVASNSAVLRDIEW